MRKFSIIMSEEHVNTLGKTLPFHLVNFYACFVLLYNML